MNNTKVCTSSAGNMTYGKIEPKSRKTDPFKAYVAAKAAQNKIARANIKVCLWARAL